MHDSKSVCQLWFWVSLSKQGLYSMCIFKCITLNVVWPCENILRQIIFIELSQVRDRLQAANDKQSSYLQENLIKQ